MSDFGPDEWAERERLDHIAQQHDEDRAAKERDVQDRLTELEAQIQELSTHLAARDHALRFVSEHAELVNAELDRFKTVVATFREYLDCDFRQWCSPYGIASDFATKLVAELDQLTDHGQPGEAA